MKNVAFYLGLGALFTHELDAMPNHEWRVLPLIRALPDDVAMAVFVALQLLRGRSTLTVLYANAEHRNQTFRCRKSSADFWMHSPSSSS